MSGPIIKTDNRFDPVYKDPDYVDFGDIARGRLGEQCQYGSRYIEGGLAGYPSLGDGLRFMGNQANYHSWKIHKDDVEEFVQRVKNHRGF